MGGEWYDDAYLFRILLPEWARVLAERDAAWDKMWADCEAQGG